MKKSVRRFVTTLVILLTLGITAEAQPSQVTIVPANSTNFTTIGEFVYFTSGDGLWRTDGTAEGTIQLRSGFDAFSEFTNFNGKLVFRSSRNSDPNIVAFKELWVSDGSPAGTELLKSSTQYDIRVAGKTPSALYFAASEEATGRELYRTNGTPEGTVLVDDINPGPGNGFMYGSAVVGNLVFFAASDGVHGTEPWKSDGTSGGTVMITDINDGSANSFAVNTVFSHNGKFYFSAATPQSGLEPWVTDGTAQGTFMLHDTESGSQSAGLVEYAIGNGGDVFFFIHSNNQQEPGASLWKTEGTESSTLKLTSAFEDQAPHGFSNFLIYKDKFFFFDHANAGIGMWFTDGTPGGTGNVFQETLGETGPAWAWMVNDHILFYYITQSLAHQFQRTDGTSVETFDVFYSGAIDQGPRDVKKVNDLVFYGDHDQGTETHVSPDNYFQLTQSDGFTVQTVRNIHGGSYSGTVDIANYNGKVVFTTLNDRDEVPDAGKQLWIYDPSQLGSPRAYFTLVNADTDEDIRQLSDGDVFTKADDTNINITFTPAEAAGSVVFELNGSRTRTETATPYSLAGDVNGDYAPWTSAAPGQYMLTATPYSEAGGQGIAGEPLTINFTIEAVSPQQCTASGTILREYWDNVSGNNVSAIPTGNTPTSTSQLTIFEGPTNVDTNYGARIRGYICPPTTGEYTFWIASNDHSELWLSTDDNPANKRKIASVTGATNPREWTRYSSQKSALVHLTAGQRYYIEALHKQGVGTDNVAVGWQLPDGTMERPITGNRLSPFEGGSNKQPIAFIIYPESGQNFQAPASVLIEVNATDEDGTISRVEFFKRSSDDSDLIKIGEDTSEPYRLFWNDVPAGRHAIWVRAHDNDGGASGYDFVTINVSGECTASGTITREHWSGVSGNNVSEIPVNTTPTSVSELSSFEAPSNIGTNYGARIRGYICAPESGEYTFWIASNDHSELWLSTDDNPANKRRIAYVIGATAPREYTKFATQRSGLITLIAGQRYYIEALHKQGVGTDHMSVVWNKPSTVSDDGPIPGTYLSPYTADENTMARMAVEDPEPQPEKLSAQISIYPNPATGNDRELTISGYEGSEEILLTDVEIINMTGDVVFSDRISCGGDCNSYLLKINQPLNPGVYLVNLKTKDARISKRLLVK